MPRVPAGQAGSCTLLAQGVGSVAPVGPAALAGSSPASWREGSSRGHRTVRRPRGSEVETAVAGSGCILGVGTAPGQWQNLAAMAAAGGHREQSDGGLTMSCGAGHAAAVISRRELQTWGDPLGQHPPACIPGSWRESGLFSAWWAPAARPSYPPAGSCGPSGISGADPGILQDGPRSGPALVTQSRGLCCRDGFLHPAVLS